MRFPTWLTPKELTVERSETYEFVGLDPVASEEFKPVPAGRMMAPWLKRMPLLQDPDGPKIQSNATLKACPGVMDYASEGFMIPMWTDLVIKATDKGYDIVDSGLIPSGFEVLSGFSPGTIPGMPIGDHQHPHVIKFEMPWRVIAPEGWSSLLVQPWFHAEHRWEVIPGIVDHDHFHTINIVALWNLPIGEETLIKAGTPLCHLIPLKRNQAKVETSFDPERWHDLGLFGRGGGKRIAVGGYLEHRRRRRAGEFDD